MGGNGTEGAVALDLEWQRSRLTVDRLSYRSQSWNPDALNRSFGSFALESEGFMRVANTGGFLNSGGSASINFASDGDVIYRQGAAGDPEISLASLHTAASFVGGSFGVDAQGLFVAAPEMQVALGFDVNWKAAPLGFDTTGRSPVILLDWRGGLNDARFEIASGGLGSNTYVVGPYTFIDYDGRFTGSRSEGLSIKGEWDFDSDFAWTIGEAGGDRNRARLYDWRRLGNAPGPMLSMPVIIDSVHPGMTLGLCAGPFSSGTPNQASCAAAGGDWVDSSVTQTALAAMIRDGRLHAYNQKVEFINQSGSNDYDWSLVYTFGKLDADIFLYPEGRGDGIAPSATPTGIRADITLLAQSPGFWQRANSNDPVVRASAGSDWETNTHFLVADTNVAGSGGQFGVGIINADLLWLARDFYLRVTEGDTAYPDLPGGLWLQTDNRALYRFRGIIGGANLLDMSDITPLGLMDVNLDTSRFIFVFSPGIAQPGSAPARFDGLLDFDNASFSFAEVSSPSSAFQITDVSGRIAWQEGSIGLRNEDGEAQLAITNKLLFGRSATLGAPTGGEPLLGRVGFGAENFGRMVLPAGEWKSNIVMRIPGS
ncbi:MAG: hypothetical protein CVV10_07490 [Gammaproteobacteria bacterium HGW-Gammaproteobacteria-14]|nr:MAG: hypothetical protein CVV10_07490 [Gammaproteobacteria bacterium HGW-Gammaproteobacteria-14]